MLVSALGPDLSSLASDAAVELDLLINGEPTTLDAVRQLGQRLEQALDKPAPDQPASALHVDTETEMVLAQAFTRAGDNPETILTQLLRRTEQIAERLSAASEGDDVGSLKRSLAFCLALSQSAAAFRQLIHDARPPHPHRR